ncbi:MAG: prolyl oligopeptidase family serine peptidase [Pseudomonadota bacterium]
MRFVSWLGLAAAAVFSISSTTVAAQMPPPPIEAFGALPAVEDAIVSPNGTYTALLVTRGNERAVTILDASGKAIKQLVVGEAKVRSIEWVGEQAILVLRTETGRLPVQYRDRKAEFLRGNVIPLDDRRPVISIFANQRSIANAITQFYGIRQVKGRWVGFFGGLRRGRTSGDRNRLLDRAPALFGVDLSTGEADLISLPDEYPSLRNWIVDKDGEVGAQRQLDASNGNWRIENANGKTIARGNQPRGEISVIGLDETGTKIIYAIYDEQLGGARRFAVPVEGGEPQEIWQGDLIERFIRQPFSSRILGVRKRNGELKFSNTNVQDTFQKTYDAFSFASWTRINDWTPEFSAITVKTSGNYDSGTWFRVNAKTDARAIIGFEYPAIQGPAIGTVSTFKYTAQDGLEIEGILTLPSGIEHKNLPAIILPHGGPTAHDVERFDWWAQAFASRGYAVLQPNFRGSTGRGRAFIDAGDGEWGKKMQSDKSDGLMALAEEGIVDPSRACIMGASYGGYAALAGVTLQQGIYRCAVSVNGVSDLEAIMRDRSTGSRDIFTRSFDRQFGPNPDLDGLSPVTLAERADAPVLLVHGRDDTVVPFVQSAMMADALKDKGKPFEFVELDGEDHNLLQADTRLRMLKAAMAFVEKHNPPN